MSVTEQVTLKILEKTRADNDRIYNITVECLSWKVKREMAGFFGGREGITRVTHATMFHFAKHTAR